MIKEPKEAAKSEPRSAAEGAGTGGGGGGNGTTSVKLEHGSPPIKQEAEQPAAGAGDAPPETTAAAPAGDAAATQGEYSATAGTPAAHNRHTNPTHGTHTSGMTGDSAATQGEYPATAGTPEHTNPTSGTPVARPLRHSVTATPPEKTALQHKPLSFT